MTNIMSSTRAKRDSLSARDSSTVALVLRQARQRCWQQSRINITSLRRLQRNTKQSGRSKQSLNEVSRYETCGSEFPAHR